MAQPVPLHEQPLIQQRRWVLARRDVPQPCHRCDVGVWTKCGPARDPAQPRCVGHRSQWIVDSYAIVFAGLLLTAGAIGDRFGRKKALIGGLVVFGLGSLVGAMADTATGVIAARVVMGFGAAFVMPATLSLLSAIFPPEERGKSDCDLGWLRRSGRGARATRGWVPPHRLVDLSGVLVGSAFLVNVVTAGLVIVAVVMFAPFSRDEDEHPLDPVGALLSLVGLSVLLYAHHRGPNKGWFSSEIVASFVVGVVGLAAFAVWETKRETRCCDEVLSNSEILRWCWRHHLRLHGDVRILLPRHSVLPTRAGLFAASGGGRQPANGVRHGHGGASKRGPSVNGWRLQNHYCWVRIDGRRPFDDRILGAIE